jgi:hypothetical protein
VGTIELPHCVVAKPGAIGVGIRACSPSGMENACGSYPDAALHSGQFADAAPNEDRDLRAPTPSASIAAKRATITK